MRLPENIFLNEVLESFVGETDIELVERVGTTGHVLWSAARRCTNVKITACERGVELRGMITSGLLRVKNSFSCLKP